MTPIQSPLKTMQPHFIYYFLKGQCFLTKEPDKGAVTPSLELAAVVSSSGS